MYRLVAFLICSVAMATASTSTLPMVHERDLQLPGDVFPTKNQGDIMDSAAAVSLDEQPAPAPKKDDAAKKMKLLKTLTLFPAPTPNFLAAFFAGILWLMIFCTGFCALFGVETPNKFVEKGLMMNKEN